MKSVHQPAPVSKILMANNYLVKQRMTEGGNVGMYLLVTLLKA